MENENEDVNKDEIEIEDKGVQGEILKSIVEDWNVYADVNNKPKVKILSKERKSKLQTRIKEKEFKFRDILRMANDSTFIRAGTWFSFDWVISGEKNYLKVLEGNYNQGTTATHTPQKNNYSEAERIIYGK